MNKNLICLDRNYQQYMKNILELKIDENGENIR